MHCTNMTCAPSHVEGRLCTNVSNWFFWQLEGRAARLRLTLLVECMDGRRFSTSTFSSHRLEGRHLSTVTRALRNLEQRHRPNVP